MFLLQYHSLTILWYQDIYFGYRNGIRDIFGSNGVDETYYLRCNIIYLISSTIVSFYFLSFFFLEKNPHINVLCNIHFNTLCWCVDKKVRLFSCSSFYPRRRKFRVALFAGMEEASIADKINNPHQTFVRSLFKK